MPERTSIPTSVENRNHEFAALIDQTTDIIARIDNRGRHLYLNRAGEGAFGPGEARHHERTADARFSDEALRVYGLAMRALSSGGSEALFDFQLQTDCKKLYFNARAIPEYDQSGHITSILMVARDATCCVEAEVERDAALMRERDVRQETCDKLQSLADSHRQTLAAISHELRSPLNGIQSWTHVLESCLASDSSTVRRALAGIRTGVEQQVTLLNNMLERAASQDAEAEHDGAGPAPAEADDALYPRKRVARTNRPGP